MKVKIVADVKQNQGTQVGFDKIIEVDACHMNADILLKLIQDNLENDIYIDSLEEFGLQIMQLLNGFRELKDNNKILHIKEKSADVNLTDEKYFELLLNLAEYEESLMSRRTIIGIKKAKEKGAEIGRPTIGNDVAKEIHRLYTVDRKTIREISEIFNLSLGTVHKYATKVE